MAESNKKVVTKLKNNDLENKKKIKLNKENKDKYNVGYIIYKEKSSKYYKITKITETNVYAKLLTTNVKDDITYFEMNTESKEKDLYDKKFIVYNVNEIELVKEESFSDKVDSANETMNQLTGSDNENESSINNETLDLNEVDTEYPPIVVAHTVAQACEQNEEAKEKALTELNEEASKETIKKLLKNESQSTSSNNTENKYTKEELDKKTIKDLKELCKELSIPNHSKLKKSNKDEYINAILNNNTIKTTVKETSLKKNESSIKKKRKTNKNVWELKDNIDDNPEYEIIYSTICNIINSCHNLLHKKAIVGEKAISDIMKVITYKILLLSMKEDDIENYTSKIINNNTLKNKIKSYLQDFKNIYKEQNLFKEWRFLVKEILETNFKSLFSEKDQKFNCEDVNTVTKLFEVVEEKFEFNNVLQMDVLSFVFGKIHEIFGKYQGGTSKALGQFFTPRRLIHLMYYGLIQKYFKDIKINRVYDPCMGSGGFLTRFFKMLKLNPCDIYGCELEKDTIKIGIGSILLSTGIINNNLINCDSLCANPFLFKKKFSSIITNPPFGTSMNYDELKENFETFKAVEHPISNITFEDIYPLVMNNGAGLFIQNCVYMLEENGICAIVLPDGELFEGNSKWSKELRKWLCNNVNIRLILKVPSGTFDYAGVKTNVVIFTKDGKTQNIQFLETNKECEFVKELFNITMEDLIQTGYSLDIGEYIEEDSDNYDVPMVALGEVCDIVNGSQLDKKNIKEGQYAVFGGGKKKVGSHNEYNRNGGETIICGTGAYCGFVQRNFNPYWASQCFTINTNTDSLLSNYLYYLSKYSLETKFMNSKKGGAQPYIRGSQFNNLKIPLPTLEVQQQIVDEFSQIETSIETIQTRIKQMEIEKEQYKKYGRKAELRRLLKDSEMKTIRDLYNINYGNKNPTITDNDNVYPSISGGSKISKYTNEWNIHENTILIARSGSCGSVNMFKTKCLMGSYGFFLNKKIDSINTQFNYYYLKEYQPNIENLARGTAVKNLNRDKLYQFKINLPSLEVQKKCIELFEEKEKYIKSIEDKIIQEKKYIEELKQLGKDIISSYCNTNESSSDIKNEKKKQYTIDGEEYIVQDVDGDGHCFFSSVSLHTNYEMSELRNMAADYILNHLEDYQDSYIPEEHDGLTIEEYIEKVRNTNEWADNDSIIALQRALNRPIIIYNEDGSERTGSTIEITSTEEPIRIIYNNHNHYDSIIKK